MNYILPDFTIASYIEDSVDKYTKWYKFDNNIYDLECNNPLLVTRQLYTNKNKLTTGICIGFKVITNLNNVGIIEISNLNNINESYIYKDLQHNDIIWFQNINYKKQFGVASETEHFTKYFSYTILENSLLCSKSINNYIITTQEDVFLECYFINVLHLHKNINIFCFPFDTYVSFLSNNWRK